MLHDRVKVGFRFEASFDYANKAFETTEAVEFFTVSNPGVVE